MLRAPPPCLVDERAVRGIHTSDDAMIDGAWQVGGEIGEFVMLAEFRNLRRGSGRGRGLRESGARWAWVGNEDPDEVIALFAGIAAGVDAVDLQRLIGDERRDQLALARVGVKSPPVVGTFDLLAVELSIGKRHPAMRAGVAQGERLALSVASDNQRLFEQRGLGEMSATELTSRQRTVPETEEHERIGRLGLEWEVVRHWTGEDTAAAAKSKP